MAEFSRKFVSPREIVQQFELSQGMIVADLGSGAGDLTLAIASANASGTVYAVDVLESAHQSLRSKAKIQGITNVQSILTDLETSTGSTLPTGSVDFVIVSNMIFQVENKIAFLDEIKRILKDIGTLVIIEWAISSPVGPVKKLRIGESELISLVQNSGFFLKKKIQSGDFHYGYMFSYQSKIS